MREILMGTSAELFLSFLERPCYDKPSLYNLVDLEARDTGLAQETEKLNESALTASGIR